jgi:hypothetical protein
MTGLIKARYKRRDIMKRDLLIGILVGSGFAALYIIIVYLALLK